MANETAQGLRGRVDAAWENVSGQLRGMKILRSFAEKDYPLVEITAGSTHLDEHRRRMTLAQLKEALDTQRRSVLAYVDGLDDRGFARTARIPLFEQFMGTDEITIPMYVGALFDYHWNDHAGQLAKIRRAAGLEATGAGVKSSGVPI